MVFPEQQMHMQTYACTIRYCRIVMYFYTLLCNRCNPLPNEMAILLLPGQNVANDLQCANWFFNDEECKNNAHLFALVCKLRCFKKPSKNQAQPVVEIDWHQFKQSKAPCWPYFQQVVDLFAKMQLYVGDWLNKYSLIKSRDKFDEVLVEKIHLVIPTHTRRKTIDWSDFHVFAGIASCELMNRVPFISAALQYMILEKFAEYEAVYKLVFF